MGRVQLGSWVTVALLSLPGAAAAEVREIGPSDDVEAAINALEPGDELVLRGGMYQLPDERFGVTMVGTQTAPIVVRAKEGERPHLHRPNASQNIIDVIQAEHAVIRDIEFSGGSAGIRVMAARFFTIEGCEVHHTNDVAVRFNSSGAEYESIQILRNHIHDTDHTGEGMYLGCNWNDCRMFNSLIEGNYVHHTNQDTVNQGDGIELKEGSHDNVIRNNVIHDTNYPCILAYGTVGNGGPNVIEGNVMWSCGDNGMQVAADATIRNNIILSAGGSGLALQPHQTESPSDLVVVHNTVLRSGGTALALRSPSGSVVLANNAIYAGGGRALLVRSGTSSVVVTGNVGVGSVEGVSTGVATGDIGDDFMDAHYDGAPPIDLFPASGGNLIAAGDAAYVVDVDFNGVPRHGEPDVGAYAFDEGGNPGWALAPAFKETVSAPVGSDGGMPMGDSDGGTGTASDAGRGTDGGSPMAGVDAAAVADSGASGPRTHDAGPGAPGIGEGGGDAGIGGGGGGGGGGCALAGSRSGSARAAAVALPLLLVPLLRHRRRRRAGA